jgi:hypothetical protein
MTSADLMTLSAARPPIRRPPLLRRARGFARNVACRPDSSSPVGNVSPRHASEKPRMKTLDDPRPPVSNVFAGGSAARSELPAEFLGNRIVGRSGVQ